MIDLTGKRFGKLTVIKEQESDKVGHYWLCKCDCGNTKVIRGSNLTAKKKPITACGCNWRTHGLSKKRIYTCWEGMKARAKRTHGNYKNVTMCKEWEEFIAFHKWAMANGYTDKLTLDRKENDKGYSPENCRWANRCTQQANKRKKDGVFIGVLRSGGDKMFHFVITHRRKAYQVYNKFKTAEAAAIARDMFILKNGWPHTLNFKWIEPQNKIGWAHG